jgi:ribosomal-protein-alanine N-acetyltransferase
MKFESERLELVEFSKELLTDDELKWFDNPDLMRFYTNSKRKISKIDLVKSIEEGIKTETSYTYFVRFKNTDKLIGTIKLGPILKAHKISDLVALIGERGDFGKGIGTEAIRLGTRLAFEKFDLRKLFGGMYESNVASIKAYTRAGWIVEGILHGHYFNNGENENRILVGSFNPKYFNESEIEQAKHENWYKKNK